MVDNARDTAQVVPLLPGGTSCMVLVTSRHLLSGLVITHSVQPLSLDVLAEHDVRAPLTNRIGQGRIVAEPAAAGRAADALRATAELFVEFLVWLLLDRARDRPRAVDAGMFADGRQKRWATVSQAVGIVATQLESDLSEASLRLCATAHVQGRRLSDVAADVIARRLRYQPDQR